MTKLIHAVVLLALIFFAGTTIKRSRELEKRLQNAEVEMVVQYVRYSCDDLARPVVHRYVHLQDQIVDRLQKFDLYWLAENAEQRKMMQPMIDDTVKRYWKLLKGPGQPVSWPLAPDPCLIKDGCKR